MEATQAAKTIGDVGMTIDLGIFRKTVISLIYAALKNKATDATEIIGRTAAPHEIRNLLSSLAIHFYGPYFSRSMPSINHEIIAEAAKQNGNDEAIQCLLNDVLYPEVASGDKDAIDLLIYFSIYNNDGIRKDCYLMLARAGEIDNVGQMISDRIHRVLIVDKADPQLIYALFAVDSKKALEWAHSNILIGSDSAKATLLRFFSENELAIHHYHNALVCCKFWRTKNANDQSLRLVYYQLILKAFSKKAIHKDKAVEYLKESFKNESSSTHLHFLKKAIEEIVPLEADEVLEDCLLAYAGNDKLEKDVFADYIDKLEGDKKTGFIKKTILQTKNGGLIFDLSLQLIIPLPIKEACAFFREAMEKPQQGEMIAQLVTRLAREKTGFEKIRDRKSVVEITKLVSVVRRAAKAKRDVVGIIRISKSLIFYGIEEDAKIALDKIGEIFAKLEGEWFTEAIKMIWVIRSKFKTLASTCDTIIADQWTAKEHQISGVAYDVIRGNIKWDCNLAPEAIGFLTYVKHGKSVGILGNLMNDNECHRDIKGDIVAFLKESALAGNIYAIMFLRDNNGCDIDGELIPNALTQISEEAKTEDMRAIAQSAIIGRFHNVTLQSMHSNGLSFLSEFRAIQQTWNSEFIRDRFFEVLPSIANSSHPITGFVKVIEEINGMTAEADKPKARSSLEKLVNMLSEKLKKEGKNLSGSRYKQFSESFNSLIMAAGKALATL